MVLTKDLSSCGEGKQRLILEISDIGLCPPFDPCRTMVVLTNDLSAERVMMVVSDSGVRYLLRSLS